MDFGRSSSEKQFGFSLLPRLTKLSDVQGNAEASCTLDGWMLPKDPSSLLLSQQPFGGHVPPCDRGPLVCWQCRGWGSARDCDVSINVAVLL